MNKLSSSSSSLPFSLDSDDVLVATHDAKAKGNPFYMDFHVFYDCEDIMAQPKKSLSLVTSTHIDDKVVCLFICSHVRRVLLAYHGFHGGCWPVFGLITEVVS